MKKRVLISTILFLVLSLFSILVLIKNKRESGVFKNQNLPQEQFIFYYGVGCPHCKAVEDFIKENRVKEKVNFLEKEVYLHKKNQTELIEKAKSCNIPENAIGVPFLWDGKNCLIGDTEIINFLKGKIDQK